MPSFSFKRVILTAVLIATLGAGGFIFFWQQHHGVPPLTPAPLAGEKIRIVVEAAVQVSIANEGIPHEECVIAADSTNPQRLLVASMYYSEKWGRAKVLGRMVPLDGIAGYYSDDRGKTWQIAFERKGTPEYKYSDPALAFGLGGSAYFACMRLNMKSWENRRISVGDSDAGVLEFTQSLDGGRTWGQNSEVPSYIDRPWLAVDGTKGSYRGRLYCLANLGTSWELFSFPNAEPAKELRKVSLTKKKGTAFAQSSNLVVLSDGTVVLALDQRVPDKNRRPSTTVFLSGDGGETMQEVGQVNTAWYDHGRFTLNRLFFPQIAADTLTEDYRDRLYYVWEDGGDKARILFSASENRGRTWTAPLVLSEQSTDGSKGQDYHAFKPSIAVNKHGAVAVSWYDRRGLPGGAAGYSVRLRVSLDGGASWLPSVPINDEPCRSSIGSLGDTAGLAADAEGHFHPVWIDDRTGIRQLWTARVWMGTK